MHTRREVLKALIVSIGGASLLTACGGEATLAPVSPLTGSGKFYNERELALVSRISDLLLPRTETPGALDVDLPAFLDQLMSEWASAATGEAHHSTLATLDAQLGNALAGDFVSADQLAAERALTEVDSAAFTSGADGSGYRGLKSLITQAYFATEAGALQEQQWVAVPGRWEPCVDL